MGSVPTLVRERRRGGADVGNSYCQKESMVTGFKKFAFALSALLATFLASQAMAQTAPDPVGEWHGAAAALTGDLTLILYVTRDTDGALKAEIENADQSPGDRTPITTISVADGRLSFKIDAIGATYDSRWSEAAQQWQGSLTQGAAMKLNLSRGLPPPKPVVARMDGLWEGVIEHNGAKLRQAMRITTGEKGTTVLYDSPDQMAVGLPVKDLVRQEQTVRFSIMQGAASFEGTLSADGTQLTGSWTSPNQPKMLMTLKRTQATATTRQPPKRPQTPKGPYPYRVEVVAFDNSAFADVHLAGTLTLPQGNGPFPAAVLISGSGAQDRDETLMGHKPFAVIADYLTRHGIAVLRYDDRGVGKSSGDYNAATSADLATDANAAFAYLAKRADIRKDAIGFIGHSEGGMIGPIAMAANKDVGYIVLLAGPGTMLDKLMLSQRRLLGSQMGMSEAELDRAEPVMAAMFHAIATAETPQAGYDAAMAVLTPEAKTALGLPPAADGAVVVRQISGPWFAYFLRYDPVPNLSRIKVPVLALNGSLDQQVPANENLPAVRAALKANRDVTIVELPGLNHLFQTAQTGGVGEYRDIEETIAPRVLETMADWINKRFGRK
jgi:uncharacterized protein